MKDEMTDEEIVEEKARTAAFMAALNDDIRKHTLAALEESIALKQKMLTDGADYVMIGFVDEFINMQRRTLMRHPAPTKN